MFGIEKNEQRARANSNRSVDVKVDGNDVIGEADAQLRDGHMTIVFLVGVERRAIDERDGEAGVVRTRRFHDVGTNLQVGYAVYVLQTGESLAMFPARLGVD